jgi:hypothetical protein
VDFLIPKALQAFEDIAGPWLAELLKVLGFDIKAMKLKLGITGSGVMVDLELLLRGLMPDKTDEEIAHILAKRRTSAKSKEEKDSLLDLPAHQGFLTGMVDPPERKEQIADLERRNNAAAEKLDVVKYLKSRNLHKYLQAAVSGTAAEGSETTAAANRTRLRGRAPTLVRTETLTLRKARTLLPHAAGVVLQDRPQFGTHGAFQMFYANAKPGTRRSKYFQVSSDTSEKQCINFAVRWAWGKHTQVTHQACPHNLDEECPLPLGD